MFDKPKIEYVQERIFDLKQSGDMREIERICSRKDKYRIDVDEPITLPFRHIRSFDLSTKEATDKVYDLSDNRDLTEIERLCSRVDRYRIDEDETVILPFRHIRYVTLPAEETK